MPCPPPPSLEALIASLLQRSDSFQGRIAARGQIQVALRFPQNARWVAQFLSWWRQGFASWRARHGADAAALAFICELGPPDYAITDRDGHELSDRWAESIQLAQWARQIWSEAGGPLNPLRSSHSKP